MLRSLFAAALVMLAAAGAHADDAVILNHTGRLLDSGDHPVNSSLPVTVRLYSKSDGLSGDIVWTETYTVNVVDGLYAIALGDPRSEKKLLSPADVAGERYLAVVIGGAELTPRIRLGTVPSAVNAISLGGHAATDFVLKSEPAPDAAKLGGKPAADYALKTDVSTDAQKLGGHPATDYALKSEVSTDAQTLSGHPATDFALKTEVSSDAQKLGGKPAAEYALKTDTAPDADRLGGKAPTDFSLANHNHDGVYVKPTGGTDLTMSGTGSFGYVALANPSSVPACNPAKAGTLYWNAADKSFYGCDGETWNTFASQPVGGNSARAGLSCKDIRTRVPYATDGVFWIDPDGASGPGQPFQVWCDMTHAGGGWTLVFNLDTNDSSMRDYSDAAFWMNSASLTGSASTALQNDYKGPAYGSLAGSEMLIWAHVEGSELNNPSAWARYQLGTGYAGKNMGQLLNLSANTQISSGSAVERSGKVVTPGQYDRTAGDVFIDNGLPIIVNSTGKGTGDATNTVRIGTEITTICSIINCNGHNVQGGYGGYHIRGSAYPLSYEAEPSFGYHTGPVGFGDNFTNNNGCGQSVWNNTCGPVTLRLQVDFAIYVR